MPYLCRSFSAKEPYGSFGSFSKNDLHLEASYESSPPCSTVKPKVAQWSNCETIVKPQQQAAQSNNCETLVKQQQKSSAVKQLWNTCETIVKPQQKAAQWNHCQTIVKQQQKAAQWTKTFSKVAQWNDLREMTSLSLSLSLGPMRIRHPMTLRHPVSVSTISTRSTSTSVHILYVSICKCSRIRRCICIYVRIYVYTYIHVCTSKHIHFSIDIFSEIRDTVVRNILRSETQLRVICNTRGGFA